MICFQRADYLKRSLAAVLKHHPGAPGPPVVVSQDGSDRGVAGVVGDFKRAMASARPGVQVVHLQHRQNRDGSDGYHKLAEHYGWALGQAFEVLPGSGALSSAVERVIVLEEDLEVAPDLFDFFAATAPLLDDPSENLLAVSAFCIAACWACALHLVKGCHSGGKKEARPAHARSTARHRIFTPPVSVGLPVGLLGCWAAGMPVASLR